MNFSTWLDTFISEKNVDLTSSFEVEGPMWGTNHMCIQNVVDAMKMAPASEQAAIKNTLVRLDFINQPIEPYFHHLAQAIAL